MQNEIAAGTKVKVAMTQKGVTTFQDAEVLAHMDGLVHVSVDGEAVSVSPEQIREFDAAAPAAQAQPHDESTAPAASAESAGEGQSSGPEAAADATGQ